LRVAALRGCSWLFVVGAAGCLGGGGRGYPLYGAVEPPPKPSDVARLTGYVFAVDGKEVTDVGHVFELLPGCHMVQTPKEWGGVGSTGGVIVRTNHMTFALPMKAAHQYLIEVQASVIGGAYTSAAVVASEKDLDGNLTAMFQPVTSAEQVASCQSSTQAAPAGTQPAPVESPH
jgi:hypothetical protein